MGPRSVNRGFDFAPVIAGDGVLRQGVGGGICQYATTLFNAVFFAGLPVVERHAHGLLIAHYPVGRDATVSWGGPDFKFENDTDAARHDPQLGQGRRAHRGHRGEDGARRDLHDERLL